MSLLLPAALLSVGSQSTFLSFLWMFCVAGRPERSTVIVNVPLTGPKSFPTFPVVPCVAKEVCYHALIEVPRL